MNNKRRSVHVDGVYDYKDYIASVEVKLQRDHTDSDWVGSTVDWKSTFGFCFIMESF
jgi:hypothetical protein